MSDVITLKEYVDRRFDDQEKAVKTALAAAEKAVTAALTAAKEAVDKANTANDKRLDAVNEFRNQQKDIIARTMPRAEMEQRYAAQSEKIAALTDRLTTIDSRKQGSDKTWQVIVTIMGVGIAIATFVGLKR